MLSKNQRNKAKECSIFLKAPSKGQLCKLTHFCKDGKNSVQMHIKCKTISRKERKKVIHRTNKDKATSNQQDMKEDE